MLEGLSTRHPGDTELDQSAAFLAAEQAIHAWTDDGDVDDRTAHIRAVARAEFGRRGYEGTSVRRRPGAEPEHYEFLARVDEPNPPLAIANHMRESFGDEIGTVFVWYEAFEKTRNSEMAEMLEEHREFFEEINSKTRDLMKVFADRLYIHPEFKGRSSIKKVLPVICPELSYSGLGIGEGLTATIKWFRAVRCVDRSQTSNVKQYSKTCSNTPSSTRGRWSAFTKSCASCSNASQNKFLDTVTAKTIFVE